MHHTIDELKQAFREQLPDLLHGTIDESRAALSRIMRVIDDQATYVFAVSVFASVAAQPLRVVRSQCGLPDQVVLVPDLESADGDIEVAARQIINVIANDDYETAQALILPYAQRVHGVTPAAHLLGETARYARGMSGAKFVHVGEVRP